MEEHMNNDNNGGKGGSGGIWGIIFKYIVIPGTFFLLGCLVRKKVAPVSKEETVQSIKEKFTETNPWAKKQQSSVQNDGTKYDDKDIMDEPYLLFKKLLHRRETAVIYSAPGVGKTFLGCNIAREAHPLKTTYLALDDQGDNQQKRILCIPDVLYIGYKEFNGYLEEYRNITRGICNRQGFWDVMFKTHAQIQSRREKLEKALGIHDQTKIDNLFVFEVLIESLMCLDSEIIILDSLNALVGYDYYINRPYIERITNYCREAGKTLICLHHTNKKNDIAGNSALSQVVDLVLHLQEDSGNLRRITVKKNRYIQGCKSCLAEMISEGHHSVRFEYRGESVHEQKNDLSPLENEIIMAFGDKETLSSETLYSCLGSHHKNSILNSLKRLEEKGMVSKLDGRTWETIKNLRFGSFTA
jgi:hypothetical protein